MIHSISLEKMPFQNVLGFPSQLAENRDTSRDISSYHPRFHSLLEMESW